jgi:hypothetical protein
MCTHASELVVLVLWECLLPHMLDSSHVDAYWVGIKLPPYHGWQRHGPSWGVNDSPSTCGLRA